MAFNQERQLLKQTDKQYLDLKSYTISSIWFVLHLGNHQVACSIPLLWNMIFLLAQKNSACVVLEEFLDTEFSYLREVSVSVARNLQSNKFTVNGFIIFWDNFSAI